ncbi:MAG TPA: LysR family transcriptional regulator [Pseudonocardiaceae bacterium]
MPHLEIRHLRVLRVIADTGSLTQAAVRLGLTQPALTSQLKRIERMVGGRLFERTRSGVHPTPYGKVVLEAARGVLAGVDHLHSLLRHPPGTTGLAGAAEGVGPERVLRLGTVGTRLTSRWAELLEEHLPGVTVRTRTGSASGVLVQLLAAGQLDVVEVNEVLGYELAWPGGVEYGVLQPCEPVHVALGRTHPLAEREEIHLAELAGERWALEPPDETGVHGAFLSACAVAGFTPQIRYHVSNALAASHAVQNGHAVTLCLATSRENSSMVVRRLAGDPIRVRRMVAWRSTLPEDVVAVVWRAAVRAYLEQVDNNPVYARWFAAHPELHPTDDRRQHSVTKPAPEPLVFPRTAPAHYSTRRVVSGPIRRS